MTKKAQPPPLPKKGPPPLPKPKTATIVAPPLPQGARVVTHVQKRTPNLREQQRMKEQQKNMPPAYGQPLNLFVRQQQFNHNTRQRMYEIIRNARDGHRLGLQEIFGFANFQGPEKDSGLAGLYPWYRKYQIATQHMNNNFVADVFNAASKMNDDKADDFLEDLMRNPSLNQEKLNELIEKYLPDTIPKAMKKEDHVIEIQGIKITCPKVPDQFLKVYASIFDVKPDLDLTSLSSQIQGFYEQGQLTSDSLSRQLAIQTYSFQDHSPLFDEETHKLILNVYNTISEQDIKKMIVNEKKRASVIIPKLANFPKKVRGARQRQTEMKMTSVLLGCELGLIEQERLKELEKLEQERKKKEEEERENAEIEESIKKGEAVECGCCFMEVPPTWIVKCPKGHEFCKKCLIRSTETAITEGKDYVSCLNVGDCVEHMEMDDLEKHLPEATYMRLVQSQFMNLMAKSQMEGICSCHRCGTQLFVGDAPYFKCPNCEEDTCAKCGKAYHPDVDCGDVHDDPLEHLNDSIVRECPKCKTRFMKEEGCNKMVCPRCSSIICYMCRKIIPPEVGYAHFFRGNGPCPPGACPLFVDNKLLHILEQVEAEAGRK